MRWIKPSDANKNGDNALALAALPSSVGFPYKVSLEDPARADNIMTMIE
jgi:hypothetical protein